MQMKRVRYNVCGFKCPAQVPPATEWNTQQIVQSAGLTHTAGTPSAHEDDKDVQMYTEGQYTSPREYDIIV